MARITKYLPLLLATVPLVACAVTDSKGKSLVSSDVTDGALQSKAHAAGSGDLSSGGTEKSAAASFFLAISMIVVSEIGDKTFLIAALMAMRHNRMIVFLGSISSLFVMTLLAGIFGQAFTAFIPQRFMHLCAALLFLVFGYKILQEGLAMEKGAGVEEEMEEVEEELAVKDLNASNEASERGSAFSSSPYKSQSSSTFKAFTESVKAAVQKYFHPVFVQVFVMVFLGEIGDRSQFTTIIMASAGNYWYVIFGSFIGHAICTGLAVLGGKYLATKISMKTVTLSGAVLFAIFGLVYLYDFLVNA